MTYDLVDIRTGHYRGLSLTKSEALALARSSKGKYKAGRKSSVTYSRNPAAKTSRVRKAMHYFDHPETGDREFDEDFERLKARALKIANRVGVSIGIMTGVIGKGIKR